jgi:hypothetical protein
VTTRQVMELVDGPCGVRDTTCARFREDMTVPDSFGPGQVESAGCGRGAALWRLVCATGYTAHPSY